MVSCRTFTSHTEHSLQDSVQGKWENRVQFRATESPKTSWIAHQAVWQEGYFWCQDLDAGFRKGPMPVPVSMLWFDSLISHRQRWARHCYISSELCYCQTWDQSEWCILAFTSLHSAIPEDSTLTALGPTGNDEQHMVIPARSYVTADLRAVRVILPNIPHQSYIRGPVHTSHFGEGMLPQPSRLWVLIEAT